MRLGRVDLDATLELGAVFDADARRGDVADHRAITLDVDAVTGVDIANHFSVNDNFARVNFGSELRRGSDREPVAAQGDGSIHFPIDLQIFGAGDVSLDLQAGTQTRGTACGAADRCRARRTAKGDQSGFCC